MNNFQLVQEQFIMFQKEIADAFADQEIKAIKETFLCPRHEECEIRNHCRKCETALSDTKNEMDIGEMALCENCA